ncbi:hypothetical protein BDW71DRAFT_205447 [Aspergillus fruticulosus]
MPSSIFDQFQSPGSYDVDFDKVWRLNSERGDDPVRFLHQLLQRVYWNAARDEFANAILAFDDYKAFVPEVLPELSEGTLESEYLRELLDLWAKSLYTVKGIPRVSLMKSCFVAMAGGCPKLTTERQKASQDERIARALLQACGFADYDYAQEDR